MAASARPVVLSAETLEFWRGFERNTKWFSKLSSSELQAQGLQPSHFCLEGFQSRFGKTVHSGVVSIPDEDLRIFAAQMSRVQTYLHEIKSQGAHPAFFDVDMKVSRFRREFWVMVVAVLEDAGLDYADISGSATMQQYLKMTSLHPETTNLPYGIVERLRAAKPFVPNATGDDSWTWLDVARAGLEPSERTGVLGDATDPAVVRPLVCVFLMAIGKLIQRVGRTFYPDSAADDTKFQVFILTNYEAETNSIHFPEDAEKGETKLGAHVYIRQLYVNTTTQLYIWQAIVDYFVDRFPTVPSADGPQAFWSTVFDAAPYTSKLGGLRMPFAYKAAPCKRCNNSAKRKACDWCCGVGRMSSARYYGPLCRIKPNGEADVTEKGNSSLFNRVYLCHMATVRVGTGTQPTPGAILEGRAVPSNLHQVQRGEIEARLGKSRAAATIRRLSDRTGVAGDSANMQQMLATVNVEDEMHDHMSQKSPTLSKRLPLAADDARFIALKQAFPALVSEIFHPCYLHATVSAASIIYHSSDGEPRLINVFVKGAGASRCFNRTVDPSDPAISGEVPVGSSSDVSGMPGRHSNWSNTVFFTIYRDDHGKIVQRCFNKQLKVNRRNSRGSQSGKPCACRDWQGEARMISAQHSQFIRDFFYTPDQQREENCRREVVAQAKALARRHSKRPLPEIGPTADYSMYVEKVVKRAKGRAQGAISVDDLGESDGGLLSASVGSSGASFNFFI